MTESSAESEGRADLLAAARGAVRWTLVAQVASQLTSLVVVGVLCRWIAPAEFGVFNTALLIVSLPRPPVRMLATSLPLIVSLPEPPTAFSIVAV